ncbi:hypothetical protein ACFXTI_044149 [Malus domestica]
MKKKYQGSRFSPRLHCLQSSIRRDFETLQMKNGESVNEYMGKAMSMANKIRIHGHKIEDNEVVEKILRSMAPKFDYVVCSIEESNDIEDMSIDELQSSLLVHKQKLNRGGSQEQALKVSTFTESSSSKGGKGGHGGGRGNRDGGRFGNRDDSKSSYVSKKDDDRQGKGKKQFDKSQVECYRRGNYGITEINATPSFPRRMERSQISLRKKKKKHR